MPIKHVFCEGHDKLYATSTNLEILSVTTLKYEKIHELVLSTFKSEFGATIESILKAFHFPSQASIKNKQTTVFSITWYQSRQKTSGILHS